MIVSISFAWGILIAFRNLRYYFLNICFYVLFVFGPHLVMFRIWSWLCTQKPHLVVLEDRPYVIPGIKLWLTMHKTSISSAIFPVPVYISAILGAAKDLSLPLHSEITPDRIREPYGCQGSNPCQLHARQVLWHVFYSLC